MNNLHSLCFSLLNACKSVSSLKQVHAFLLKEGMNSDRLFAGMLLQRTVTFSDSLDYSRSVFTHTQYPDAFMYNTLIRGFVKSGMPHLSIGTFMEMQRSSNSPPDSFSFSFMLKAAAHLRSLETGIQLHCQALVRGLSSHLFVATTLISMYGECRCVGRALKVFYEITDPNVITSNAVITACLRGLEVKKARKMFDSMSTRDVTSWNLLLAAYMKVGETEHARNLFAEMPVRNDVSWSIMIGGFSQNGILDQSLEFFRDFLRHSGAGAGAGVGEGGRVEAKEVSMTGAIAACARAGALEPTKMMHGHVEKTGFDKLESVNNALLDAYSKCGDLDVARVIFKQMEGKKSIITWTTMMAGLAAHGHGRESIEVFSQMEQSGTKPDEITLILLLYACSHAGLVEQGCWYFNNMRDLYDVEPTVEHYGCMVDLYGRAGRLRCAYDFLLRMPIPPNDVVWRTLLGACLIHADVELAETVKDHLSLLDPDNSGDRVLLSNIYAVVENWNSAASVRRSMNLHNIKKSPGLSLIQLDDDNYHSFI